MLICRMTAEAELLAAERRLQAAQLASDVEALDALLDDRLMAVGPDGSTFTKAADLEVHRSGALKITVLDEEALDLLVDGTLGITRATFTTEAIQDGELVAARLTYTRTWVRTHGEWRLLAAHFGQAAAS
jgi:hypothetical protein